MSLSAVACESAVKQCVADVQGNGAEQSADFPIGQNYDGTESLSMAHNPNVGGSVGTSRYAPELHPAPSVARPFQVSKTVLSSL